MVINTKLSPIPQIYTLETTILAENNFCKFYQISRKIYIVGKIVPKNEFGETLMSRSAFGSIFNVSFCNWVIDYFWKISMLFHKSTH